MKDKLAKLIADQEQQAIEEFKEFLRIPSVSTLSEHLPDMEKAAEWLKKRCEKAGFEGVKILQAGESPAVYAEWMNAPNKPTVLIYGHFDVQPAEPLEEWLSDPFDPLIKDGLIYARGASDSKGNVLMAVLGVECALKELGTLPVNVKFLFEAQEEIGSPDMPKFISENKELLVCDMIINSDGGQYGMDQPEIVTSMRGLVSVEVEVRCANTDLHSGNHGGVAQNANFALTCLLAAMKDPAGNVLIPGFYDQVRVLSDEEKEKLNDAPFDEADYLKQLGLNSLACVPGVSPREALWKRPTLEINGMYGGFQGEGVKTVIPRKALAKITCRLVADQDPEAITQSLKLFIENFKLPGATFHMTVAEQGALPYNLPSDHATIKLVSDVLFDIYGKQPVVVGNGASIPILSIFLKNLERYSVTMGFALDDENLHAPNEFLRLKNFNRGQLAFALLISKFNEQL